MIFQTIEESFLLEVYFLESNIATLCRHIAHNMQQADKKHDTELVAALLQSDLR